MKTTTCRKCGTTITIDFGSLTYAEARERCEKLDSASFECPGYHVELGGWTYLWRLDELLASAFPGELS